jgi:hypothetical protein
LYIHSPVVIVLAVDIALAAKERRLSVERILADAALQAARVPFLIDSGQIEAILRTRKESKEANVRRNWKLM